MRAVRSKGNRSTERRLRSALSRRGIGGWRLNVKDLPGTPDFVFDAERVAVFVDGCFWHGCPKHCNTPVNNHAFWQKKLAGNQARDRRVTRTLRKKVGAWSAFGNMS